jgi:HEAT repeat protein
MSIQQNLKKPQESTLISDFSHLLLSWEDLSWEDALELAIMGLKRGDFQQRWELTKILPKLGVGVIPSLLQIWENETEEVELRWFVGRILGQFSQPEVILSLVKVLQESQEEDLLTIASESLANFGQEAIYSLTPLLVSNNQEIRLLVIKALAQIRSGESIEPLASMIDDPNPEIRALVVETLGSFHQPQITDILVEALQDKAGKVRKQAAIALGFRHSSEITPGIVDYLQPLLSDLNPEVCQEVAFSLGRIGTIDAIEALFPVLKSPATPAWLKLPIIRALNWCENSKAIFYLGETLNWVDVYLSEEIILNLGRQNKNELKQQATDILVNYLLSQNGAIASVSIRQKIAISLGNLEQKNARKALELLSQDSEQIVRLHANYALKQMECN